MKSIFNVLIGILAGMLLAGGLWLVARQPQGEPVVLRPAPTPDDIVVHVAGAVVRPGVYRLPDKSRVADAIDAAGGFLAEAEKNKFNLAAFVEDGTRIDVPYVANYTPQPTSAFTVLKTPTPFGTPAFDLIDINTASLSELDTLPGIGPTTAQRIIDYRIQNGPFASIEDIVKVPGIGSATYENIKHLITVGD
ncbi:MAG: helix-hairpin-helix domain-containing protein [Anaerolineales bacterium]